MKLAAGIDFGGTSAKIGLVDRRARSWRRMPGRHGPAGKLRGDRASRWRRRLRGLLSRDARGRPPGHHRDRDARVHRQDGRACSSAAARTSPPCSADPCSRHLANAFTVPAFAENDATAAAAGELAFGAGRRFANFVLITVGTAIGGGLVLGGRVYRGSRGFAGEIGHLCVSPGGLWCNCGSRGCFEQYASGTAIARIYAEKLRKRGAPGAGAA